MQQHTILKVCTSLLILVIPHVVAAQVVYSDGATHTIPGDPAFSDGQYITLEAASGLAIYDDAAVNGGDHLSNQSAMAGPAVSGQAGTSVMQFGGDVTGGVATTNGDPASMSLITAVGGAGVATGGAYVGSGGTLNGGFAYAESSTGGGPSISDFVNSTGGPALSLSTGATADLSGMEVMGGNSEAWFAEELNDALGGDALLLVDSGPVVISSGMFTGGTGTANAFVVNFADATGQGGVALDVRGSSSLTVDGGTFTGGIGAGYVIFFAEPAEGIGGAALKITGPSTVTINAGTFVAGSSAAGTNPPEVPVTSSEGAITVVGDAGSGDMQLTINGGSFDGFGSALQTLGTSPNATDARIDIYGGDLDNNDGDDITLSNPDITTTIHGSDFLLDGSPVALGPVTAPTGTLEGTLTDGSPFEWNFMRLNDAPLLLAPACDTENTDVTLFVNAVISASTNPTLVCMYDMNSDHTLNGSDIQGFIERILGP